MGQGGGNDGEAGNNHACEDEGVVHGDSGGGIAGGLAAPVVWMLTARCAGTVLVRVGRQI